MLKFTTAPRGRPRVDLYHASILEITFSFLKKYFPVKIVRMLVIIVLWKNIRTKFQRFRKIFRSTCSNYSQYYGGINKE